MLTEKYGEQQVLAKTSRARVCHSFMFTGVLHLINVHSRWNHLAWLLGVLLSYLSAPVHLHRVSANAGYANSTISLPVTNTGEPSEGYIQVTVYEIKNNQQEETDVFYAPLALQQGENTALIPGTLEPGTVQTLYLPHPER